MRYRRLIDDESGNLRLLNARLLSQLPVSSESQSIVVN